MPIEVFNKRSLYTGVFNGNHGTRWISCRLNSYRMTANADAVFMLSTASAMGTFTMEPCPQDLTNLRNWQT